MGVGGTDVGVSVGVGIAVGVAADVSVGGVVEALMLCPKERRDEKKIPITTTRTIIRISALSRRVRCIMLQFHS